MKELIFPLEFKGKSRPVEGKQSTSRTLGQGLGPKGEKATFRCQVVDHGETFDESGSIELAGRGAFRFESFAPGYVGPSPIPGLQRGGVIWRIIGGEGEFLGATGLITSNFTLSEDGEVRDSQYVRMYLP